MNTGVIITIFYSPSILAAHLGSLSDGWPPPDNKPRYHQDRGRQAGERPDHSHRPSSKLAVMDWSKCFEQASPQRPIRLAVDRQNSRGGRIEINAVAGLSQVARTVQTELDRTSSGFRRPQLHRNAISHRVAASAQIFVQGPCGSLVGVEFVRHKAGGGLPGDVPPRSLKRLREGNAGPRKCKGRQDANKPISQSSGAGRSESAALNFVRGETPSCAIAALQATKGPHR